ncbi:hypothetical protein [Acidocella sp.]|uniref:DUF3024 domain-containing protein n=1 Tax=Acidocella sp. TaxID=50710 RepID=UPI0026127416|nr:hypothetical protein [Acidocella sp.]
MMPHPNELDQHRIERALARRIRYRYVAPRVVAVERGYRIESPCCSRNINGDGGIIDIALLIFESEDHLWALYRKNHGENEWLLVDVFGHLPAALGLLAEDVERKFWQ